MAKSGYEKPTHGMQAKDGCLARDYLLSQDFRRCNESKIP